VIGNKMFNPDQNRLAPTLAMIMAASRVGFITGYKVAFISLELAQQQIAPLYVGQLAALPRAETARVALSASRIIVARDLAQCVAISNQYGPEHLIIQTRQARELVDSITSAGSVFLGDWSPESAGDYASGTNHVLPTYGYTATCSSLGLADFQKRMTVQELSRDGFAALASTIEILAAAERLDAHKNAVTLRVAALKEQA
ncbi:histidinol dehydrogenase, partial [Klebsiella pneumoniae]|uniref:histidinol dehydrogenase n=1 Tax=Klebsiella pneumoniae TaxID=573 RepID=UPI00223EE916